MTPSSERPADGIDSISPLEWLTLAVLAADAYLVVTRLLGM